MTEDICEKRNEISFHEVVIESPDHNIDLKLL